MRPATIRSTESSDDPGCVQIRIDLEAATFTLERSTVAVFLLLIPTSRTCTGSVSWIYGSDFLSDRYRLIFYHASQFCETPLSKLLLWFWYYPVSDLMIHVPLKPSLSTWKRLKLSFCRSSAYGLKFWFQILIFTLDRFYGTRLPEGIITAHSNVVDS